MEGHRLEIRDEPRRVEVAVDGTVIASSTGTVVLAETGLPLRYYFPRADVRMDLLDATPTETVCPFKGQASYWSVRDHRDVAWSYETPIEGAARVEGLVCFYAERAEHRIDGETQPTPESPWSPRAAQR